MLTAFHLTERQTFCRRRGDFPVITRLALRSVHAATVADTPISLELRRRPWMRRWTWTWSWQKLEREELGIIQLGGKNRAVAVGRKL